MQRPAQSYSSAQLLSCVHRRDTAACSTEQAVHTFLGLFEASSVIIVSYCSDHYHHLLHLYFLPTARLILDLTGRSISPPHPSKEWRWSENLKSYFYDFFSGFMDFYGILVEELLGIGLSPKAIPHFSIFFILFFDFFYLFIGFYDFLRSFLLFIILCLFKGFLGLFWSG